VAVVPKNERVFEWLVSNGQVDIISFDISARLPFYLKPPLCAQV
jgi:RNase P/RNase MRP subunit p30